MHHFVMFQHACTHKRSYKYDSHNCPLSGVSRTTALHQVTMPSTMIWVREYKKICQHKTESKQNSYKLPGVGISIKGSGRIIRPSKKHRLKLIGECIDQIFLRKSWGVRHLLWKSNSQSCGVTCESFQRLGTAINHFVHPSLIYLPIHPASCTSTLDLLRQHWQDTFDWHTD